MILNQVKRLIIKERMRFFFYEIAIVFLLIFVLSSFEWILLPLELNPDLFGIIFYIIRAVIIFFAIPIVIIVMEKIVTSESDLRQRTKISAFKSHFMLYKMSKSNYKYQLLYGVLLLFLVFIPLDFFLYLLTPEMLLYNSFSLGIALQNSYLFLDNFLIFFTVLVIIQVFIAFAEETVYRGFINKRGSEHFNRISAVLISTYSYGFLSLLYYLDPVSSNFNLWFPIVWFLALFLIGLVLSLTVIRRKWIFPSIFANSINNIIMVGIFWYFLKGGKYLEILIFIYMPLLIGSIILFIWQYHRIKDSISIGLNMLKSYVKNDEKEEEKSNDKYFRILFDFCVGILVFLIGLLIAL
ncbi:MAG: type II CAAX prenyl endopeptidase Rce1 family protein [Candidatus Thorarchaeota archaeon]